MYIIFVFTHTNPIASKMSLAAKEFYLCSYVDSINESLRDKVKKLMRREGSGSLFSSNVICIH